MAVKGRPTRYTAKIADVICRRLVAGESLRSICRDDDMPSEAAVRCWVTDDRNGFAAHYARARNLGLDTIAEEIIEIADETSNDTISSERGDIPNNEWISRSRLRVDARKWLLSKLRPDKYGDRVAQEISGPGGGPVQSRHEIVFVTPEPAE